MQTTIRFHMNPNEPNLAHNTDEEVRSRESHIRPDPETGHALEIWCSNYSSAEEAVADILSDDLDAYNKKQKRKGRRMTMEQYIQSVKDDKRGKGHKVRYKKSDGATGYKIEKREQKRLLYEGVVSCGNSSYAKDASGKARYDRNNRHIRPQEVPREVNYAVCKRYYETFEKRNPNFKLINFVWHSDEGFYNLRRTWEYDTEHGQFIFVPIAEGYKQSLARQVSIGHALMNMGYADKYEDYVDENGETKSKWVCAYTLWERDEAKYLEQLLQEEYKKYCRKHKVYALTHGKLEIIHPVQGRNAESLAPNEYAAKQRLTEEVQDLTADKAELIEECHELGKAVSKKKKFGKKILVSEDAYNSVLPAAEVVIGMEENKIASDRSRRIAEEQQKAAEDKYDELEELCTNEKKYIDKRAEMKIAEHKRDLDAKFKQNISDYKKDTTDKHNEALCKKDDQISILDKYLRTHCGISAEAVIAKHKALERKDKLNTDMQSMNIPQNTKAVDKYAY